MEAALTPPEQSPRVITLHPNQLRAETTSRVGMVLYLASGSMMFTALFAALLYLRVDSPSWPPVGVAPLPLLWPSINTAILVMSSVVLHFGVQRFRAGHVPAFKNMLLAVLLMGAAFLGLQFMVWVDVWNSGMQLTSGKYASFFYLLTAFHAIHVLVGLAILAWLVPQVWRPAGAPARANRIRLAAVFWHFVDVVWVLLFVLVYAL
jgi:cytochrome c oxidase subunit 3